MAKRKVRGGRVFTINVGARAPRGGVTRQGVVLTDLQSLLDCQYKLLSLALNLSLPIPIPIPLPLSFPLPLPPPPPPALSLSLPFSLKILCLPTRRVFWGY